ncbi:hypothetical protein ACOR62_04700 [Neisseria lisongii]|uniref:Uncharacterized protein n=1 Tax=Neisseria lisongii TaxID=2912188 RepID=A0AAW5AMA7_9NEIS|nr:hypothetical protein [Neisseria lisongii]MCF7528722.1 hypothetical protein [Neisseria lisongii]MCF7529580.1 hypothetical protein [Neisseria lisongii]
MILPQKRGGTPLFVRPENAEMPSENRQQQFSDGILTTTLFAAFAATRQAVRSSSMEAASSDRRAITL